MLHLPLKLHLLKLSRIEKPFESCSKTENIQGYSDELREPIRTRENCYPLIWWILKRDISSNTYPSNSRCHPSSFILAFRVISLRSSSAISSTRSVWRTTQTRPQLFSVVVLFSGDYSLLLTSFSGYRNRPPIWSTVVGYENWFARGIWTNQKRRNILWMNFWVLIGLLMSQDRL